MPTAFEWLQAIAPLFALLPSSTTFVDRIFTCIERVYGVSPTPTKAQSSIKIELHGSVVDDMMRSVDIKAQRTRQDPGPHGVRVAPIVVHIPEGMNTGSRSSEQQA